jgi:hypothetical protein
MHLYHANQTIRNARDVLSYYRDTYRDRPIPSIGTIFNNFKI